MAWRKTYLREYRLAAKMTLTAAAEAMGLEDHSQLSKIERGLAQYDQNKLEAAADLYGCTVIDLLTRPPGEAETFFSRWGKLKPAERRRAMRLLDAAQDDE